MNRIMKWWKTRGMCPGCRAGRHAECREEAFPFDSCPCGHRMHYSLSGLPWWMAGE